MRGGGRDDVQRVAGGGGLGDGSEDAQLVFLGDFAGGFGVRVVNAGEFHLAGGVEFGINAGVMLAERAGAEDGDFDFCHARSLPVNSGNGNQKCRAKARRREVQNEVSISNFAAFASFARHFQLSTFNRQLVRLPRVPVLAYILTALGAYLLGSIPSGFLVAKAKGIDIRSVGSGNIGATNAMRVLGKPAGIFVLLMDALKGYAACRLVLPPIFDWF